jgi:hypothetical protein
MHILGAHVELASQFRLCVYTKHGCEEPWRNWKKLHQVWTFLEAAELESTLAAWFKWAPESNASIDGTHLKEKALHIAVWLEVANFSASSGWINRFKRKHNIVYRIRSSESRVLIQGLQEI